MYYLYCYENLINDKVYIGYTNNIIYRDMQHSKGSDKVCMPIDRAILKYGRINFSLTTMLILDNIKEIQQEEIYWIAKMREVLGKEKVYNIADGGIGGLPKIPWNKGKKMSKEYCKNMSKCQKGKKYSLKSRKKRSEAAKKNNTILNIKHMKMRS